MLICSLEKACTSSDKTRDGKSQRNVDRLSESFLSKKNLSENLFNSNVSENLLQVTIIRILIYFEDNNSQRDELIFSTKGMLIPKYSVGAEGCSTPSAEIVATLDVSVDNVKLTDAV